MCERDYYVDADTGQCALSLGDLAYCQVYHLNVSAGNIMTCLQCADYYYFQEDRRSCALSQLVARCTLYVTTSLGEYVCVECEKFYYLTPEGECSNVGMIAQCKKQVDYYNCDECSSPVMTVVDRYPGGSLDRGQETCTKYLANCIEHSQTDNLCVQCPANSTRIGNGSALYPETCEYGYELENCAVILKK